MRLPARSVKSITRDSGTVRCMRSASFLFVGGTLLQQRHHHRLFHLAEAETERTAATLVRNFPLGIDDVKSARHAAVGGAHRIVDVVHDERHRRLESLAE